MATEELFDPYKNATDAFEMEKKATGVCYDYMCLNHECDWDVRYPENPNRLLSILNRYRELQLDTRCKFIQPEKNDFFDKIITDQSSSLFNELKTICTDKNENEREIIASQYDSIYFHKGTFNAACASLNCVLNLVYNVATDVIQNGMAICRPPGHHADYNNFNGYCYFNNVAIATEMCIQQKLARRVLIIDYDVHHGHGTQDIFYNRNDVMYFSIHRYEYGTFWPNLRRSDFDHIGIGEGCGYNVNVPLNATGLHDSDYLAIVFYLLLPLAFEFKPDIIIVSAGYDAAIGCPEGEMLITPGFYMHLMQLLSCLANGKIAVVLEGGYCTSSLAEGVCMTIKGLLGDPCPQLDSIQHIHRSVIETIQNVKSTLQPYWKCFLQCSKLDTTGTTTSNTTNVKYYGVPLQPPYDIRFTYPVNTEEDSHWLESMLHILKAKYKRCTDPLPVCYIYDETMLKHDHPNGVDKPENSRRLIKINKMMETYKLDKRCTKLNIIDHDLLKYNIHNEEYLTRLLSAQLQIETKDMFSNEYTGIAVRTAISGLLTVIDHIMNAKAKSGIAIIRPPGHHAEFDKGLGFCHVNNVAIGANYLLQTYNCKRILIVDFDVHHGNGTQKFFYCSKQVMYISVHRYEFGKYFPCTVDGDVSKIGEECGIGYNINVPFNKDKMGDSEYLSIFLNIILPIAYSFQPNVVLISAGFDAGICDPLGCYRISPEMFGIFTKLLMPIGGNHLILALEGGYNINTLSLSVGMCIKSLLGDAVPLPLHLYEHISLSAFETITHVKNTFKTYWPILNLCD